MNEPEYERGVVVKGPGSLAGHTFRPYVCLSDETPPFRGEEAVYRTVTTTRRSVAMPLADEDLASVGPPEESYVNPWTLVTIRHADMRQREEKLVERTVEAIAESAASYPGVDI